jgi:hypothetical protein
MFEISIYFFVLILPSAGQVLLSAGQVQKSNKKVKATPIALPLRRDVAVPAHPSSISTINRLYSAFCFGSTQKLSVFVVSIYFLCLDAKKVTKKNQGKHERSARFAVPAHSSLVSPDNRFCSVGCFSSIWSLLMPKDSIHCLDWTKKVTIILPDKGLMNEEV